MAIQPKKRPVIQKGSGYTYVPGAFDEHKVSMFHVVDSAEEMLSKVKPFELMGRRFITFDTETHPHFANSQQLPETIVRRWVGSGKQATPQDYPFCISVCDGKASYTLFDTVANDFAEFKKLAPLLEDPTIEKIAHNTN